MTKRSEVAVAHALELSEMINEVIPITPTRRAPMQYDPSMGETLIELARMEGCPFIAGLAEIGISQTLAAKWIERFPHFKECKERAESEAIRFWHKVGVLGALGKIKNFNSECWKLYMKNIAKFQDKVDISAQFTNIVVTTQIGSDGQIDTKQLSDEEAAGLLESIEEDNIL